MTTSELLTVGIGLMSLVTTVSSGVLGWMMKTFSEDFKELKKDMKELIKAESEGREKETIRIERRFEAFKAEVTAELRRYNQRLDYVLFKRGEDATGE
jgi:hypothetical protein